MENLAKKGQNTRFGQKNLKTTYKRNQLIVKTNSVKCVDAV